MKKIEPTIINMQGSIQKLEEDLKQLLICYGEDPTTTKPEEFFGMIVSFGSSLTVGIMVHDYGYVNLIVLYVSNTIAVFIIFNRKRSKKMKKSKRKPRKKNKKKINHVW